MLTIEQIKKRLEHANLFKVALAAKVDPSRVYRLMRDEGKPLYETVKLLSDYLESQNK